MQVKINTRAEKADMQDLFGIFFEDLNHAADGGLYAELIQNRAFEFCSVDNPDYHGLTAWEKIEKGGKTELRLASLVGYLEAIEHGLVVGEEKEEYIHVASDKAYRLKDFVISLFEWVKLDAREQIFHFEIVDLNEMTRNIIADWVSTFENNNLKYEIEIPETEYFIRIDPNAYTRILNNLLQNIMVHSKATQILLSIIESNQQAIITLTDNGQGILPEKISHIFERMYQCDDSRSSKGNGLGLSIAKELVNAHKGTINVASTPNFETTFAITLPKAL